MSRQVKLTQTDAEFLREMARWLKKTSHDKGEDAAYWANISNAERCEQIAVTLENDGHYRKGYAIGRDVGLEEAACVCGEMAEKKDRQFDDLLRRKLGGQMNLEWAAIAAASMGVMATLVAKRIRDQKGH